MAKCIKCNKPIKTVYLYNLKPYGSNCIQKELNISLHPELLNKLYTMDDGLIYTVESEKVEVIDIDLYLILLDELKEKQENQQREHEEKQKVKQEMKEGKAKALYTTLKNKNLSKITNEYKLNFIQSVKEQYEKDSFISDKQHDIIYKWLNSKDKEIYSSIIDPIRNEHKDVLKEIYLNNK